jgi:hypothetical protein
MSTRFIVRSLALAAAITAAVSTQAAHAASHHVATSQGHPALAHTIAHNAAAQQRVAADLGRGRLSPQEAAALQTQVADIYRAQATALDTPAANEAQLAASGQRLSATIHDAEAARRNDARAEKLDRMHLRVAALRDAEQQRWIAQGLRSGHLSPMQAAQLERAQADLAAEQSAAIGRGHETVQAALQMQHRQDAQDWAIHDAWSHRAG